MKGELNSPRLLKKSDSFFFLFCKKERRKTSDSKVPDCTSLRLAVPSIEPFFLVHESEGTFFCVLITGVGTKPIWAPFTKTLLYLWIITARVSLAAKHRAKRSTSGQRAIVVGSGPTENAVETMTSRQKCRGQYSSVYHATNGFPVKSTATADRGQKSTYLDKAGTRLLQMCTACFSYGVLGQNRMKWIATPVQATASAWRAARQAYSLCTSQFHWKAGE